MTSRWKVMVMWKYGFADCIQLKEIKDLNPVEVTKYVVAKCIQGNPELAWRVSKVLRRWNIIRSKMKSKYWRMTQNFGIRLNKTVKAPLMIDKEAGNDY